MATLAVQEQRDVPVKFLKVNAHVRYWEDASVNGVSDDAGDLTPCRKGDVWSPLIDLDTGVISDWPSGVEARIHFKVCDEGEYSLLDEAGNEVSRIEGYVPSMLSPGGSGYGDYIIMNIDGSGVIEGWETDLEPFESDD